MSRRIISLAVGVVAVVWGVIVMRMAIKSEAEPPMGAICFALPAFGLLIAAGAIWPKKSARRRR